MKNKERLLSILAVLISIASIISAISTFGVKQILSVDWDILGWVTLSVGVFTLISVFISTLLMMKRHRILKIYFSYPIANQDDASKIKELLKEEFVLSTDSIQPGSSVSDLSKIIKRSNFCFFAVGKSQSAMQKEELKIMRTLGKKIYVISMDDEGKVPQVLRGEMPLYINDENIKDKIDNIILEYK